MKEQDGLRRQGKYFIEHFIRGIFIAGDQLNGDVQKKLIFRKHFLIALQLCFPGSSRLDDQCERTGFREQLRCKKRVLEPETFRFDSGNVRFPLKFESERPVIGGDQDRRSLRLWNPAVQKQIGCGIVVEDQQIITGVLQFGPDCFDILR